MKEVNAQALDEFLGNKVVAPVPTATEVATIPQPTAINALGQVNQGLSTANSGMSQAVELIKGANELMNSFSGLFLKGAEKKADRMEAGGFGDNNGSYQDYAKQQMQGKNPTQSSGVADPKTLEMSYSKGANDVHEWIYTTVKNAPEEMTLKDFMTEWQGSKKEFVEIISRIFKNDTKWLQKLNVDIADKEQVSRPKQTPKNTSNNYEDIIELAPKGQESSDEKLDIKKPSTTGTSKKSKSET